MNQLLETFYTAFQQKDAETMVACYHDDIVFHDPAFGELKGDDAKAMWRMLCKNATDLKIEYSNLQSTPTTGSAHWEAWYTFSRTGKPVHNIIDATFEFKDGKIIRHTDSFNLHRWASQAMGFSGWLLGWTGVFQQKLQQQTKGLLSKFRKAE